jgi:uncharacterized protein (TIGR00106 family)
MLMELSVLPVVGDASLSPMVAKAIDLIDKSGLDYHVGAMATVVEGEWDELLDLARRCHEAERRCADRVITSIKIDDRKGASNRLDGKKKSVEAVLKHPLK